MKHKPFQQAHGSRSNISIEDNISQYMGIEMVTIDSFIEAMIRWQTVCQHCQHATCNSIDILYCRQHDVSSTTDEAQ